MQLQQRIGQPVGRQHGVVALAHDAQPDRRGADQDVVHQFAFQRARGFSVRAPQQVPAPVARAQHDRTHQQQHGAEDDGEFSRQRGSQHPVRQVVGQQPELRAQLLHQQHARARVVQRVMRHLARPRGDRPDGGVRCRPLARRDVDHLVGFVQQRQQGRLAGPPQFGEEGLHRHARGHQHVRGIADIGGAGQHHDGGIVYRMAQRADPDLLVARRHGVAGAVQQRLRQPRAQQGDQRRVERHWRARAGIWLADDNGAVFVERDRVGAVVEIERLLRGHGRQRDLAQAHELRRQRGTPGAPRGVGGKQVVILVHGLDVDAGRAGAPERLVAGFARGVGSTRVRVVADRQHGAPQERQFVVQQLRDRGHVLRHVAAAVVQVLARHQAGEQAGEQHDRDQHRDRRLSSAPSNSVPLRHSQVISTPAVRCRQSRRAATTSGWSSARATRMTRSCIPWILCSRS
ncbi:hypothetical protein [Cupriavidus necator]|uniref:hypothetical protein n=1 Tax=Cupriavidus necator TaxID=106590 RepID=UPI00068A3A23|nr:hypothetical protein [Cupriavidus necator]